MASRGWVCPKCGKVWAPFIEQCENCNGTQGQPAWPVVAPYTSPPSTIPDPRYPPWEATKIWCQATNAEQQRGGSN